MITMWKEILQFNYVNIKPVLTCTVVNEIGLPLLRVRLLPVGWEGAEGFILSSLTGG